jgi:DNA invertase Pin-like site-specific DNA recombinase
LKVENLGIESFANGKPNPIFKMISDVLANVSELTRNNIKESQKQGIAIAKAKGIYQQRATRGKISNEEFLSTYKNVVKELNLGVNSLRKIAVLCDVSLDTVQKVKKILKEQENEKGIN